MTEKNTLFAYCMIILFFYFLSVMCGVWCVVCGMWCVITRGRWLGFSVLVILALLYTTRLILKTPQTTQYTHTKHPMVQTTEIDPLVMY